jgi:hypothetical protein
MSDDQGEFSIVPTTNEIAGESLVARRAARVALVRRQFDRRFHA